MRIVAFNAWSVGNRDIENNLHRLVEDAEYPLVLAGSEFKKYRGSIDGYQRLADDDGHEEDANCVLFVRDDVHIRKSRFLRPDGPWWVGPKHGDPHPPRVFPWAVLDYREQRFEPMAVHRTPGGPYPHIKVNGESWKAEHLALVEWYARRATRHPNRPIIAAGDWNNRKWDKRIGSVSNLAAKVEGRLLLKGIDGALVTNAARVKGFRLPGLYGSDGHRPVVVDIRPKEF